MNSEQLMQQTDLEFFWHCLGSIDMYNYTTEEVDDACSMFMMGGQL